MAASVPSPARSSGLLQPLAPAPRTGALRAPWHAARLAAVLSLTAGWIHFAFMASHFRQWWLYGMFFLASGVAQSLFTVAILRFPRPSVVLAGIVMNLAIVLLYIDSRTVGVPIGPHADVAERTKLIDLAVTGAELVTIGALLVIAGARMRRWAVNAMLLIGGILWYLRLTDQLV